MRRAKCGGGEGVFPTCRPCAVHLDLLAGWRLWAVVAGHHKLSSLKLEPETHFALPHVFRPEFTGLKTCYTGLHAVYWASSGRVCVCVCAAPLIELDTTEQWKRWQIGLIRAPIDTHTFKEASLSLIRRVSSKSTHTHIHTHTHTPRRDKSSNRSWITGNRQ